MPSTRFVPNVEKIEHKDFSVTRDLLKKAGELGLSGVEIPEAYGGLEMDKVTAAVIADHIAKYAGFATTWGGHTGIGTLPIVYFGTEEQKKKYLPRLAAGEIVGAYALSEASSGSDALNCRARAELSPDGKHYILNGEKMWITNAGFADLFTVFAKVDGEKFTAFLVEKTFPGILHRRRRAQDGHSRIVHLPDHSQRLQSAGRKPAGRNRQGPRHRLQHSERRPLQAGRDVRRRRRASRSRTPSATPSSARRSTKSSPTSAWCAKRSPTWPRCIYVGESLVYRTVGMMDVALDEVDKSGADAAKETRKAIEEYAVECSIIKVWGSEMIDYVVDETVQIYAGYGFVEEYPAERAYRDARINRIFEGTNEINRLIITGFLLKRAMTGQLPLMPAIKKLMDEVLSGPSWAKNSKARSPKNASWSAKPRSSACSPPARPRRNTCRPFRTSRKSWAPSPT